jgi:hypothetical protein
MAKTTKKDAEVYNVPALVITPEKAPAVTGNFEQIEKCLEGWRKQVLSLDLTEDNMEQVRSVKKAAVALRNRLSDAVDATKKRLFNEPKAVFEARAKTLLKLVGDVESVADDVLAKEERERIDGINQVLDSYKDRFQEQYQLDEQHCARLEYRKQYYNKGTEEKARKDDLEQQFIELKKAQDAYAASVKLITATCRDEPRLNADRYIRDLAACDVATIIEEISAEKERLHELDRQQTQTATSAAPKVQDAEFEVVSGGAEVAQTVLGVPCAINFESDFPGRTKKIRIEITYPCDLVDALQEMFAKLKPCGIKIKQLREEVAF